MSANGYPPTQAALPHHDVFDVAAWAAARPKHRYWVHILLLLATLLTTTIVGSEMAHSFAGGRPFDFETDLMGYVRLWRDPSFLLDGLPFSLTLLTILMAHEMGHFLAARYYKVDATLPFFLPAPTLIGTFGAFIRIRSAILSKRILFDIGVAGPMAGFAMLLAPLMVGVAMSKVVHGIGSHGELVFGTPLVLRFFEWIVFPGVPMGDIYLHPVARAAWVGLLATALNLLPIGQLDGGHVLYAFLGERTRIWSRFAVGILALLGLFQLFTSAYKMGYMWLFWAAFLLIFGMRHPAIVDPSPVGRTRTWLGVLALVIFLLSFHGGSDPHRRPVKISATIITYNEERNLPRAIESLRCADEIVVIDSGSSDRTVEIAEKLGARVVECPWPGYANQKNRAADEASHDWILSIDADESLSESLEAEIWQLKKNGPQFDAYTMPRMAQYLGRWIRHSGWYPDRKVRLYHRAKAKWVGEFVHESVKVEGRVGNLESNLLHFTCSSLSEHLKTMDRYTTLAAEQMLGAREKPSLARLLFDPPWTFFNTYVVKLGFLDGVEGLAIANMAALYNFVKYAKARFMSPGRP